MMSAIRTVLGVSVLVACVGSVGCSSSGSSDGGSAGSAIQIGGGGSSSGGTGSGGGGDLPAGVPLTPTDGWVDAASNTLGVVGAVFAYSDTVSGMGLTSDFTGSNACIKGTAAKVDLKCTPMPPATDCYGQFWGAAIGMNLNQPIDPATKMGVTMPLAFDASALKGFAFDVTGTTIPAPSAFRFKVENANGEFCTPPAKSIKAGANNFTFADLEQMCWMPPTPPVTAETAKSGLIKISWQVVTNSSSTVPFDFCISNIRAVQ